MNLSTLRKELEPYKDSKKADQSKRFFKTGIGEYGENEVFLGITAPVLRRLSKAYMTISVDDNLELLKSKYHEERLLALFILVLKFQKSKTETERIQIYESYIKNFKYVNNWDFVDSSAHHIVGAYLIDKDRQILRQWANSDDLWTKRIAMMSTFYFIKQNEFNTSLDIAKILLFDKHDLIHKAVGWMLREIGNRSINTEEEFLKKYYKKMPRTMLRYATEKFPEEKRQAYLKGAI
ncbi:MAG: DNA alkylation repair protein [Candidatus Margulisbacteria bacterium GWF2_35_9]|nr:MAG: DNA alkylation repair protein [Candidatus Margulisbacteria bacterium GWF2_35_9]